MVHTNRHASAIYRHVHKVTINHLHEGKLKQIFDKVVNGWQIRAEIFELDLTIHTNGYHSFIDGTSRVEGINLIDRGYEHFMHKLGCLEANVTRLA